MDKTKRMPIIAGNWKMNNDRAQAAALIKDMLELAATAGCEVAVCPPFTSLETALALTAGSNVAVGAQNCHFESSGAYTGEISAGMLAELGIKYVIIGHSERRQYFAETDETVNKRLKAALGAGLHVILCVGERLEQREQGVTSEVCAMQLKIALGGVSAQELERIVVAYEPVWAIGTGRTATPEQAQEVCADIRGVIARLYGPDAAGAVRIQYGGSMNAGNAAELLGKPDIDGGLIGGASLKARDFSQVVKAASV